jgi:putative nucleotidyltransferase with HDIG domain
MSNDKYYILEEYFSGDKQLPTAPVLYSKFNEMIENDVSSNKEIAELVIKDQAMVAKILRLSNSAMYARRGEITDLTNAITFLGIETIKDIILQISLVRTFPLKDKDLPEFNINTFWEHSLGTAYFATAITKKLGIPHKEYYYLGGLLHDIGKLVIYQFYPNIFKEIILKEIDKKISDIKAEEAVLGVDHTDIGFHFGEKWGFEKEILEVIRDHHKIYESLGLHVCIIRMSNLFAKAAGLCFPWDSHIFDLVGDPTWEILAFHLKEKTDIELLVTEIMVEADKIRESVKELLSENE